MRLLLPLMLAACGGPAESQGPPDDTDTEPTTSTDTGSATTSSPSTTSTTDTAPTFVVTVDDTSPDDTGGPVFTNPCDVVATENGDTPASSVPLDPGTVCGDIDRVDALLPPDGDPDLDFYTFSPASDGTWSLTLDGPNLARYDLFVLQNGAPFAEALDVDPATIEFNVVAGRDYTVYVWGVSGVLGDYELSLDESFNDTGTLAKFDIYGEGVVSGASLDRYEGTERWELVDLGTGLMLCEWTLVSEDWATAGEPGPPPIAPYPCTDPDGNPCTFAFSVRTYAGAETGGYQCDQLFGINSATLGDIGSRPMGFTEAYYSGGFYFGSALMYLLDQSLVYPSLPPGTYRWFGLVVESDFDGSNWDWRFDQGLVPYTP